MLAAIALIILGNLMQQNPDLANGMVQAGDWFVFVGWATLSIYVIVYVVAIVNSR